MLLDLRNKVSYKHQLQYHNIELKSSVITVQWESVLKNHRTVGLPQCEVHTHLKLENWMLVASYV